MFGLAIALASTACQVQGTARVHAGATVVYQEPPQPQVERVNERTGFLWVKGHWDWQNGAWAWVGGHWEKERTGSQWREGRWERRGSAWHWVPGEWIGGAVVGVDVRGGGGGTVTVDYPTEEPPAPEREEQAYRPGQVFIQGRWEWKGGKWAWSPGRYEAERPNQSWNPGRWSRQGARWVWVDGEWTTSVTVTTGGGTTVTVDDDYPDTEPPAPKAERQPYKPNHVWVKGHWEWKGRQWVWVAGRYEKLKAKQKWVDGKWEKRGAKWHWVEGGWQ
jgi:hypothetical protein